MGAAVGVRVHTKGAVRAARVSRTHRGGGIGCGAEAGFREGSAAGFAGKFSELGLISLVQQLQRHLDMLNANLKK